MVTVSVMAGMGVVGKRDDTPLGDVEVDGVRAGGPVRLLYGRPQRALVARCRQIGVTDAVRFVRVYLITLGGDDKGGCSVG